ncbi:MAG: sigma-54 dependent transcriptional regulator [Candidatus Sumerlaeota bacterium]|nr:sigma-54 dependent transcriptional regulator [Candidatus Sumerlaeota bacterium]
MSEGIGARILVADDDDGIRFTITEIMKKEGYQVDEAVNGLEASEKANSLSYDLIILDIKMPKRDGLEVLKELRRNKVDSVVVMITAHGDRQVGIEAIRSGAYDFFTKPFELDEFRIVIRRALERRSLEQEIRRLQSQLVTGHVYGRMIGQCEPMRQIYQMIENVAPQDVTVLIRGESGTGKELVAREIHERSTRRGNPFVSLNCAAIPESLLESELFGHERGAFTGAIAARPGRMELANKGTFFLDEIGDMPLALQAKMLRVLQEREIERVGGTKPIKVDIRILAATNQDLEVAVEQNRFRNDLFFRLNVVPIVLPPLRVRLEDIPLLTGHFIERFRTEFAKRVTGVDENVLKVFMQYEWPGNLREMENAIQRAMVMATGEIIQLHDLPDSLQKAAALIMGTEPPKPAVEIDEHLLADFSIPLAAKVAMAADRIERAVIELALAKTGGKREETADLIGMSRKSLYNKMQKMGIG